MTDISKERAASIFRLLEFFYPDDLGYKFLGNLIYIDYTAPRHGTQQYEYMCHNSKKKQLHPELHEDDKNILIIFVGI